MNGHRTPLLLAALALFVTHVFFLNSWSERWNPNVLTRSYMAMAIVDHGSLQIDPYLELKPTEDSAFHDGHYYSDKAPGFAILLVPVAWLLRATLVPAPEWRGMIVGLRVLGLGLPVLVFWLFALRYYEGLLGDRRTALAVVLAGALGTNFFIFATNLFSHVPAGVLLFGVFLGLRRATRPEPPRWLAFALGLTLATAFVTDFILALTVLVLGSYALWLLRARVRDAALFCLGCAVPLGLWLWMNAASYGSAFTIGFHLSSDAGFRQGYRSGFMGIQPPESDSLLGMWTSRARGMLFLSPFLVLAPFGFVRLWRRGERRDVGLSVAIIASVAIFASTTLDWGGGWSIGVRYLVPTVPLLLIGVAGALVERRDTSAVVVLFPGLAVASIALVALSAATFPFFPKGFEDPIFQVAVPLAKGSAFTESLLVVGPLVPWVWLAVVTFSCGLLLWLVPAAPHRRARTVALSLALATTVLSAQWITARPSGDPERDFVATFTGRRGVAP